MLKTGKENDPVAPGQYYPVSYPPLENPDGISPFSGADVYRDWISGCEPWGVEIGNHLQLENGNMVGPTKQGVLDLINQDPGAYWDTSTNMVGNSSFGPSGSPRLIRIPFFDPGYPPTSGKMTVKVTNIASLFLEGIDSNGIVTARIAPATGTVAGNSPGLLKYVRLIE